MVQSGRVTFGEMEAVAFGRPAAEAIGEEAQRLAANRVFLMVSGTLNPMTGEIAKVHRCEGSSDCICRTACKRPQTPLTEVVCCSGMSPRRKHSAMAASLLRDCCAKGLEHGDLRTRPINQGLNHDRRYSDALHIECVSSTR